MKELYFITHNKNKFTEAKEVAKNFSMKIKWINLEYEEIQSNTLEKIAKSSCVKILEMQDDLKNKKFFLEDAGLFIKQLDGFPGPYSSYVFKTIGNEGILKLLDNKQNREAYFKSVIAFYKSEKILIFRGITEGEITKEKKGCKGFGFDPIFLPRNSQETYAEMSLITKNLYSHRQKALQELFTSLSAFVSKKW